MELKRAIGWLVSMVCISGASAGEETCENQFYAIAHMTNLIKSVEWALEQGANGIEMDLNFDDSTTPTRFHHGLPCDCSCFASGICNLDERVCRGESKVNTMFTFLELHYDRLAMVYIDTKTDTIEGSKSEAGQNVGKLLIERLFEMGYKGSVIVGVAKLEGMEYLQGVVKAISASSFEGRVAYTIDQEDSKQYEVLTALVLLSPYRAYSVGISACSPSTYYEQIKIGYANYEAGVLSLPPMIWTVDKSISMEKYVDIGARGVMSNDPSNAAATARSKAFQLATPANSSIPKSTNDTVITTLPKETCDCDYHAGGCTISEVAPTGRACMCVYKGGWTCGGDVVPCYETASELCIHPDKTIQSCAQGGGDCLGYSGDSDCDCDYSDVGGCTISKAAPQHSACMCVYKGGWTCGGEVTRCNDDFELCKKPDTTFQSCILGGGDCEGYSGSSGCDCDYHSGGCTISKVAPKHSACMCVYKGWYTCGGSVVQCQTEAAPQCNIPDATIVSCNQGGGDCGGY
jgi:hypothetical protein